MDTLKRETNRLHSLIEDLLAISRFDQERISFDLEPVLLDDFLAKLIADRTQFARENGLTLTFEADGEFPPVSADRSHLQHMVSNLLTNAISYTGSGGSIDVRMEQPSGDHDVGDEAMVMFQVVDSGMGIEEDELEKIFERFYRGNASHKTHSSGTGLGLSIVQEIVTRLHGTIRVDSQPGRGTTVSVELPVWGEDDR